nr:hypothetical protein [uncultured bacterium]
MQSSVIPLQEPGRERGLHESVKTFRAQIVEAPQYKIDHGNDGGAGCPPQGP